MEEKEAWMKHLEEEEGDSSRSDGKRVVEDKPRQSRWRAKVETSVRKRTFLEEDSRPLQGAQRRDLEQQRSNE